VELKARFANPGRRLWPGQFVNIKLTLQILRGVTTIPASAVNRGPAGVFVYIVGANGRAVMQPVKVAWTQGETVVVAAGVRPGQLVVNDGQMILKPGSAVRIMRPSASARP
jgi:multidrug efflux system membrane fusion protein